MLAVGPASASPGGGGPAPGGMGAGGGGGTGQEMGLNVVAPVGGPAAGPPQVSLSLLIEMIVQRTYHDLSVLAELLPRKTDMERKVEIFNYASRY